MEGYADSACIICSHRDFNVNLPAFHPLAENPHVAHFVQQVWQGTFGIINIFQICNNLLPEFRCDFQLQKRLHVFASVVTEDNPKHFRFLLELG